MARKFLQNEEGSFGVMAAISSLMLVMFAGSALEIMRLHSSQAKLQILTDNMALTAAVYIRDNVTPPTSSSIGFTEGTLYTVEQVNTGQTLPNVSGNFSITYNEELGQAEAAFDGKVHTAFLSAFHNPEIDISARSEVKYPAVGTAAISVAIVVDNSGSMAWDDKPLIGSSRQSGTISRIEGLINTAKQFNGDLYADLIENAASTQTNYLRMGMIPYNTDVIANRIQNIDWSTLNDDDIDDMSAGGGTDSRGPLNYAKNWMTLEDAIHENENGEEVKKYVVLMSDGSNNEEWVCDWRNKNRTRLWRRFNGFRYEYTQSRRSPGSGWTEGIASNCQLLNNSNSDSLSICTQLKNDNVEVFTIGFALAPGIYYQNYPYSNSKTEISQTTTDTAYGFLSSCASSSEHFIKAEDADELAAAFEKIGKKITEDSIRIVK